jgi:hypothetical protein
MNISNQIEETAIVVPMNDGIVYPKYLRAIAKLLTILFHPLFIPIYVFLWMHLRFPTEFAGMDNHTFNIRAFGVFWTTAFFPAFVVFILWRLKMIKSLEMNASTERIIPYVATMFFYWWMWYLSRNFTDQASALKFFYFGIFLATIPGLIFNNFFKISMHGMGIGGLIGAVTLTCYMYGIYLGADLIILFLLSGLVLSSRLLLKAHNNFELYMGVFTGLISQFIAYYIFS